jgi:hypothetical protein
VFLAHRPAAAAEHTDPRLTHSPMLPSRHEITPDRTDLAVLPDHGPPLSGGDALSSLTVDRSSSFRVDFTHPVSRSEVPSGGRTTVK